MPYQITTRHVPDEPVVSVRGRTSVDDLSPFVGTTIGHLLGDLGRVGVTPAGPILIVYHEFGPDGVEAEVCVPVAPTVDAAALTAAGLTVHVLPGVMVAETTHVGSYEDLSGAYAAIATWIAEHDRESIGPARERYLAGPGEGIPETAYVTRIEFPISEALVPVG